MWTAIRSGNSQATHNPFVIRFRRVLERPAAIWDRNIPPGLDFRVPRSYRAVGPNCQPHDTTRALTPYAWCVEQLPSHTAKDFSFEGLDAGGREPTAASIAVDNVRDI